MKRGLACWLAEDSASASLSPPRLPLTRSIESVNKKVKFPSLRFKFHIYIETHCIHLFRGSPIDVPHTPLSRPPRRRLPLTPLSQQSNTNHHKPWRLPRLHPPPLQRAPYPPHPTTQHSASSPRGASGHQSTGSGRSTTKPTRNGRLTST